MTAVPSPIFNIADHAPRVVAGRGWIARIAIGYVEVCFKDLSCLRRVFVNTPEQDWGMPWLGFLESWRRVCHDPVEKSRLAKRPFALLFVQDTGAIYLGPQIVRRPWRSIRRELRRTSLVRAPRRAAAIIPFPVRPR